MMYACLLVCKGAGEVEEKGRRLRGNVNGVHF